MEKVRVGVLGCGTISDWHLSGWREVEMAEVVAVCDILEDRARYLAEKYGITHVFTDYNEMLINGQIDAVDICLPHDLHARATIDAANEGKHVLVEKPMANTLEEAIAMITACDRKNVKLMIAHIERFNPVMQLMKKVIDSGLIGDVHMIMHRTLMHKDVVTQSEQENSDWKLNGMSAGGGCLHRCGIHSMDLIRWLSGSEVTRIYAETGTFVWDVPFETASHVSLRFDNGVIGIYDHTWFFAPSNRISETIIIGSGGAVSEKTNGPAFNSRSEIEIKSSRLDSLIATLPEFPQLFTHSAGNNMLWGVTDDPIKSLTFHLPVGPGFAAEQAHFTDSIMHDKNPLISGRDGARALEMVTAAYLSAESNEPQKLPLISF